MNTLKKNKSPKPKLDSEAGWVLVAKSTDGGHSAPLSLVSLVLGLWSPS